MTKKTLFQILAIVGFIIICICAFVIPNNPNEMIYSISKITFDKMPLWLAIILVGSFIYEITLFAIYDKITNK